MRRHRSRGDAGRRISRAGSAGATTASTLFAPTRLYGKPDDFRRFVDDAHRVGLAVILDVVYNHVGPDGAFFTAYRESLLLDALRERVGRSAQLRRRRRRARSASSSSSNAVHWIDEYHLDGLRFDATQTILRQLARAHPRGDGPPHARGRHAHGRSSSSARTSRRRASWCDRRIGGRLRARRALERRLPPQRARRADRDTARPTTPTTSASRRSSSPPPSTATSTRGSGTRGRRRTAARRRGASRPRRSSATSRTTTRWRTRSAGCGSTSSPAPGATAR